MRKCLPWLQYCSLLRSSFGTIAIGSDDARWTSNIDASASKIGVNQAAPMTWASRGLSSAHAAASQGTDRITGSGEASTSSPTISSGTELFRVIVSTGRRRGAGTTDRAWVQLCGANISSELIELVTEGGFERGSVMDFRIPVPLDIGPIKRLKLQKMASSGYERGRGWYLKQIEVESPTMDRMIFPCNSWLGESDCGSVVTPDERNLLPAANDVVIEHFEPIKVVASGLAIPHPDKVKKGAKGANSKGFGHGGEDAYFFTEGKNNLFGMGVADGVYMWRHLGIDAGRLSQAMMATSMHMVQAGVEDVFKVLQTSARYVQSEGVLGSTTICILTINQANGQMHAATLGDSGFMVFGPPKAHLSFQAPSFDLLLKLRSYQLEHEFGKPYQIGHHEASDHVEDADLVSTTVTRGDIVVMGSDGLFDNVGEGEMASLLSRLTAEGASASGMAQALTKLAFEISMDKRKVTPYSEGASEAFNMVYSGGKPDDISVVVAQIK